MCIRHRPFEKKRQCSSQNVATTNTIISRQILKMCGKFLIKILNVFDDLIIRPFTGGKIPNKRKQLDDKHGWEILSRCYRNEILFLVFNVRIERQDVASTVRLTRNVASTMRMTFSLTADWAMSVSTGMISNLLEHVYAECERLIYNNVRLTR